MPIFHEFSHSLYVFGNLAPRGYHRQFRIGDIDILATARRLILEFDRNVNDVFFDQNQICPTTAFRNGKIIVYFVRKILPAYLFQ